MLSLPGWMITIMSEFAPAIYGISTWYKVELILNDATGLPLTAVVEFPTITM